MEKPAIGAVQIETFGSRAKVVKTVDVRDAGAASAEVVIAPETGMLSPHAKVSSKLCGATLLQEIKGGKYVHGIA